MKKRVLAGFLAILALTTVGCQKKGTNGGNQVPGLSYEEEVITLAELDDETTADMMLGMNEFSMDLLKNIATSDTENVLLSPLSIGSALGMTANGAETTTLNSMMDMLTSGGDRDTYNAYMKSVCAKNDVLKLANSIWINEEGNIPNIANHFLALNDQVYGAQVFYKPFNEETKKLINDWVKANTDEMIPEIIDNLNPLCQLVLANAATFEAEWLHEYEEDDIRENQVFHGVDGDQDVVLLYSFEDSFIKDDMAIGFIRYYKDTQYAFLAMLPNEDVALTDYVASLDGEKFLSYMQDYTHKDVNVWIPEFTFAYNCELNETLKSLGMGEAFTANADFSGITAPEDNNLCISTVLHKTFIALDRKGTKAAAATVVMLDEAMAIEEDLPEYVCLDRPFLFAIVDMHNKIPVFVGTVNNIE